MAVTEVLASLFISGRTSRQTSAAVTAALGVEPSYQHEFGDPHPSASLAASGKVTSQSRWVYEEPRTIASAEDPHGMESLVRLAERFEPLAQTLHSLRADYHVEVELWGTSNSSQGGLLIGPETMRRLGLLGATFIQTINLHDEVDAEDIARPSGQRAL